MRRRASLQALIHRPWWQLAGTAMLLVLLVGSTIPMLSNAGRLQRTVAMLLPLLAALPITLLIVLAVRSARRVALQQRLLNTHRSLSSIRRLSWRDFETLVAAAFRERGYRVQDNTQHGADDGIDLVLTRGRDKLIVQCKHWRSQSVSVPTVRELQGVISATGANGGVLVCTGRFTRTAVEFAERCGIELVDGQTLAQWVQR